MKPTKKILTLLLALIITLTLTACDSDTTVPSNSEPLTAQSETTDELLSSSKSLPYEVGQVSVISNNTKYEPYIHMASTAIISDGQLIDGVGKFLSLEEVSMSLPDIQYGDDFQVIVEGENAESSEYSLYNDKFEHLYIARDELSFPNESGIYLLSVIVTWCNGEADSQHKEYTLNEYFFKVKV